MTWLDQYTAWATECTDAPAIFHRWGGYMALSSALGRRLTFRFGAFDIAPNLYVLLLAPSSIYRKSTALHLSKRIAGKCAAYALTGDGSPEGFIEDLREHPQGTLYYSELSALLAQFDREYAAALRPLLTDLYDTPDTYRRKLRSAEINILKPCISIFAASVLDWVMDKVKQADFAGGFLTRFILVSATRKEKSMAIPPPADIEAENRLTAELHNIVGFLKGEVSLEPIRAEYEKWVAGFEKRAGHSPLLAAFISRLQIACLKLAVLEAASDGASQVLSSEALARAINSIEDVADATASLEDNELGYANDRESQDLRTVSRIVRTAGEVGWSELLRKTRLPARRLDFAVKTLTASGELEMRKHPRPKGSGGWPIQIAVWRGNGQGEHEA